jgi:predicted amidohydrolase
MLVTTDLHANEVRILRGIEQASRDRADYLLTPEGSLSGYYRDFDRQQVADAIERISRAAREAAVGLALGTCSKEIEQGFEYCYNQVRVYTPEGAFQGFHAKILRCSPLAHPGTDEMHDYVEGTPRTFAWQGSHFGCLICNDLWATPGYTTIPNPYLAWRLKQMGAQVILHAINSGDAQRRRPFHEASQERWAEALGIPIVSVNAAAAPGEAVNAASGLIGADGTRLLVVPDTGEQYFVCEADLVRGA